MDKLKMDVKTAVKEAIKSEQEAQKMYMKGARLTKLPASKQLFRTLVTEERGHEILLKNLDTKHPEFPNVCKHIEIESDIAMAEANELGEIRYLLEYAVDKEKEAYAKYKALEKSVKDKKLKKIFDGIAKQEQCHEKMLTKELKKIFG
jgi:rubrerythrin